MKNKIILLSLLILASNLTFAQFTAPKVLNGKWEMGYGRKYDQVVNVPAIASNPKKIADETLWYRKEVKLPAGKWEAITLQLKGARFRPEVYINGKLMAKKEGGMAPIFFELNQEEIKPGNTISLEIALASLKNVPESDASYIPQSDQWRSNVSSGLWDDVVMHFHGLVSIDRIMPFIAGKNETAAIRFDLKNALNFKGTASLQIMDQAGKVLITNKKQIIGNYGVINIDYKNRLKTWSPKKPHLYKIKLTITNAKGIVTDQSIVPFGIKTFEVRDKQFYLNATHFIPRGPTVVWHRWMRTKEGLALGYDTTWFKKNIIQRTKDLGGNYLRFHLGLPPERLLDLCDKYGLVVQFEWSFFHGMPASKESLISQYKQWLDLAIKHPSVSLIHPYNETEGNQLKTVWAALDELLPQYPPLIVEDRDVMHIHKYWWSMFENIGLYYDNANVFPKAIMADEFGGNYLDQNGNLGGYPSIKESYLRFLGREHTVQQRLAFHTEANTRIAEYWRRIGAAGYSPFCALGSEEDGNNWFLGPLAQGNPKPVWQALSASFSPQSVSLDLWDKNFQPGQKVKLPVYVFNDENVKTPLHLKLTIEDKNGIVVCTQLKTVEVDAFSKIIHGFDVIMPSKQGLYCIKATLLNKPHTVKHPVTSAWNVNVFEAVQPEATKKLKIGVASNEIELLALLKERQIDRVDLADPNADLILTSKQTWAILSKGNASISELLKSAIANGKNVVMLDVGDRFLGQGYPQKNGDLGPLQGVVRLSNPKTNTYQLFDGIALKFTEAAEPESFMHPAVSSRQLWQYIPKESTGIWNGMRGGLLAPAADMEFSGLSEQAFVSQWKSRGALEDQIATGPYFAYELQGFYDFSSNPTDPDVQKRLKEKVQFLVQDAPSLANAINPLTPIMVTDLKKGYEIARKGVATGFTSLANCGKNLTRTPVALVSFGDGKGKLLVSQLLTAGRLAKGFGEAGAYGIRYDEVTVQYVLNMINVAADK